MAGHIRLGLTADTLQDYMLDDVRRRRRQLANPMAPRLATGGEFNDYENWSLHAVADWREGVGKRAEDAAGFLYGEIESRVPEQLILPSALDSVYIESSQSKMLSFAPGRPGITAVGILNVGGTGNPTRVATQTVLNSGSSPSTTEIYGMAFLGYIPDGVEVTVALYTDSGSNPGSSVASGTLTADTHRPGLQWYYVPMSSVYRTSTNGLSPNHYWVIYPTSSSNEIQVAGGAMTSPQAYFGRQYSGSSWSQPSIAPFFITVQPYIDIFGVSTQNLRKSGISGIFTDGTYLYAHSANYNVSTDAFYDAGYLLEFSSSQHTWGASVPSGGSWSVPDTTRDELGGPVLFDGVVYFPAGSNYNTWTLSTDAIATSTNDAHLFAVWAGYIWRAYNNQLWYSADGTTWTEVAGGIGGSDFRIRGLAGLGANMYVCTDEALYSIYPGDVVVGVFPWGTVSDQNGKGMISHQGALYIPAQGRLWKFTEDGTLTDIWISRDDDLNARRLGKIAALSGLNNALVVGVDGTTSSDPSSVWAYTGLGWHHITTLPAIGGIRCLYYDRLDSRLWISADWALTYYVRWPDWALNPYNDSSSVYMQHGWMETDRLYLGSRDLLKDVESVRAYGEFASGASADVYWRDQDSTDWELLGNISADGAELRWDVVATRPATRWIKIGLLLKTTSRTVTPQLRAWVLKAMPMIRDRWRWDLVIDVADNQQMIGGQMDDRYADEKRDALEGLISSVAPVLFEDVDGRQYWVKVQSAGESLDNYENDGYGTVQYSMKFNLSLEQIESVFS